MDDRQFDGLARAIGQTTNRRQAVRGLMALAAGAVGLKAAGADAARRGYGGPGDSDQNDAPVLTLSFLPEVGACRCLVTVANAPPSPSGTVEVFSETEGRRWGTIRIVTTSAGRGIGKLDLLVPQRTVYRGHASIQGVEFDSASTTSCG